MVRYSRRSNAMRVDRPAVDCIDGATACRPTRGSQYAMMLHTNDYLEYYLTLVGWIINSGVWNMIEDSGLVAAPFAAIIIIISEWLKARAEGADEGNKGVLSLARVENRFYTAILVIIVCCMPLVTVSIDTLQFDRSRSEQCQYSVPNPADTGWNTSFSTLNGKSAVVPVWWLFVHAMSKAATAASIAAIPCGVDLQQVRMDVNRARINDPLLAQEVADFTNDCYARARAKLFMTQPTLSKDQLNDVNWIGSRFFLQTPGYYNDGFSGFRSHTPRTKWPYDTTRDAGLPQTTGGGGFPTCTQWWSDSSIGLRARLLEQVSPDLLSKLAQWANFMTQTEVSDSVIRDLVSPRKQKLTQGQVYTDYGGQVGGSVMNDFTRLTATVGQAAGSLAMYPAMDSVRQAAPMVMAFLKMALIICIPFVLVFGMFDLKVVMTITFAEFALIFVDFWFQLARWVDSTILDALYGNGIGSDVPHSNFDPVFGASNAQGDLLLDFVIGAMFIVLPSFWVVALGWTGMKLGSLMSGLTDGVDSARQASSKGANQIKAAMEKTLASAD
ncbi:putative membrane protein [Pseudomonas savastanoi pv. nerii]|uniref:Membrane protein n=14 Tax=Pseudomonas syringae group TaxID=136849 RepID=A0AB74BIA1_PSESS|nr:putative membrane protein [Pseudomonas savastanoi pv. nerii]